MKSGRHSDYLVHMREAVRNALDFTEGLAAADFYEDKKTQQAVIMSLMIIGEAASRLLAECPEWAAQHPDIPWRNMRGMRNRIAHGYFAIDLAVVWETVQSALPQLQQQLQALDIDK